MPHYLFSICYPADAVPPSAERLAVIHADVVGLQERMKQAGVFVFSGGLHGPSTATVVTARDGGLAISDGPFVETKEQIGGISIIEVGDLDEALAWAGEHATAIGVPIEVRPFEGRPH